ncbi:MAG TPA: PaaI family thioesterase [Hyphomicrobiales bacterium]|nr:PaaI family thioesterase [Hyphomicrobiales bacterium]
MGPFEPKDPLFRARVMASFNRQEVMRTLGVEVASIEPGEIVLRMPYAAAYTQQHGFIHAGIVATALDSACGYAAFSLMPKEAAVLTVEFKLNLLAPARGEEFVFKGWVLKPGRTITVCEGHALASIGNEEKLVATMVGTLMAVFDRPGISG